MLRIIPLSLVLCIVLFLVVTSQSVAQEHTRSGGDDENLVSTLVLRIQELERTNADLLTRIDALEQEVESLKRMIGPPTAPQSATLPNVIQVEVIQEYDTSEEEASITDMQKAIASKRRGLQEAMRKSTQPGVSKGARKQAGSDARRIERELWHLERDLAALQRKVAAPQYWVMGWDGEFDVMILTDETDRNLALRLSRGDFVMWDGKIVERKVGHSIFGSYEIWTATGIKRVIKPAGFVARPDDWLAVWDPERHGEGAGDVTFPRLPNDK